MPDMMTQEAPFPVALAELVKELTYRPGWHFSLQQVDRGQGSVGLTFCAVGQYPDTYAPENTIRVMHYFIVPAASYNAKSWRRWLFDRILEIERHEAAEFFQIGGERPYAPNHGPGHDPYFLVPEELTTADDRRVRFDGTVADS